MKMNNPTKHLKSATKSGNLAEIRHSAQNLPEDDELSL